MKKTFFQQYARYGYQIQAKHRDAETKFVIKFYLESKFHTLGVLMILMIFENPAQLAQKFYNEENILYYCIQKDD